MNKNRLEELLQKALRDPVKFTKLFLKLPFCLSEKQKYVLRKFYAGNFNELLLIIGRKGGKDVVAAIINLIETARIFHIYDTIWKKYNIVEDTKIYAFNIAPTRDQAENILLDYVSTFAKNSWYFSELIVDERSYELEFLGNVFIRAQGSNSTGGRGFKSYIVIFDEIGHFLDTQGRSSGTKIYNAYKPNALPFRPDHKLIYISSPAGKSGIFWELYDQKMDGKLPYVFMEKCPTWEFNPEYPFDPKTKTGCEFLVNEYKRDPFFFWMEYGAEFADVVNPFFIPEKIDACSTGKIIDITRPDKRIRRVVCLDPAESGNRYALTMQHKEGKKVVVDYVTWWQGTREHPVQINEVEDFLLQLHKNFWLGEVALDQHQSQATIQRLKDKMNIHETTFTGPYNMEIYQNLLELTNMEDIILPDMKEVKQECKMLQRKQYTNRFKVEAAPGFNSDIADCIANGAYLLTVKKEPEGRLV